MSSGSMPLAFGAILTGGWLLDRGVKDVAAGLSTSSTTAGTGGASSSTGSGATPTGSQKSQVSQAAAEFGLSPQTLWGVFGTESSFGANPGTSSAGAQGPFQFIPSTWATWGHGSVYNFTDALVAAAALLKHLGADSNPNSPQTIAALNAYNGNGGGSSLTSYAQSVLHLGAGF